MSPSSADALSHAIDQASAAVTSAAEGDGWPWLFARCWMLANRFERHGRQIADLETALDDFARLPADAPGRPRLAAVLVNAQLRAGVLREPEQIERVAALAAAADGDQKPLPGWSADRAAVRALWLVNALQHGDAVVDARTALAEIDQLAEVVGTTQPHATMIETMRVAALHVRTRDDHDIAGMEEVNEHVSRLRGGLDPGSPLEIRAQILAAMQTAMAANARGDLRAAAAEVDRVVALRRNLPAGDPLGAQIDEMSSSFQALRGMLDGTGPATGTVPPPAADPMAAHLDELRSRAERSGISPTERAMYLAELGVAETGIGGARLDDAVEHLRAAIDKAPVHDTRRTFYMTSYGVALVGRFETRRSRSDLDEAIRVLEQARDLAVDPANPHWAMLCQVLGHAYRLSGRRPLGRQTGRDGLRGHAWSVLLQSGTAAATAGARHAATDAVDVARWCLDDNDPAGAAAALDAGRGLVLQAATQISDVSERLTALGAPELAERWRRAVDAGGAEKAPIDLRREVVRRLADLPAQLGGAVVAAAPGPADPTLTPPEPHEIRAALARLDADALVYLVPGERGVGAAVVIPARDEPSWLPLPELTVRSGQEPDRYVVESTRRDAGLVRPRDIGDADPGPSAGRWRHALSDLCDWAWTAAVGPLLDRHLPRHHELPDDRPPRLILVPMGELARVPWHAARHAVNGRRIYAIERAVFSYAVSARLLCDSTWADDVALTPSGLVIGDPDTGGAAADLPAARTEALAIRDAFYGRARYVGRNDDGISAPGGTGSRAEVEQWLADEGSFAGTVLHAACHGVVQARTGADDTSYLLLAGGEHLAAEELIRKLTTRRGRGLALTVLAACSSGVPGRGYDEAFSLATAFLASGTRSVVSALWSIPDSATSVLMFMFHHYLRHGGVPAADALREAQLWMLRPDRQSPDIMPDELQRQLTNSDPADIVAWAGFTHAGR